jgi:hypothetical protein
MVIGHIPSSASRGQGKTGQHGGKKGAKKGRSRQVKGAALAGASSTDEWCKEFRKRLDRTKTPGDYVEALADMAGIGINVRKVVKNVKSFLGKGRADWDTEDYRHTHPDFPHLYAAAIHAYTLDGHDINIYKKINAAMNNPGRTISEELCACLPFIKLLDTALLEAAQRWGYHIGEVLRGVKYAYPKPTPAQHDVKKHFPKGRTFYWYFFVSSALDHEVMYKPDFCGHRGPRTIFYITSCEGVSIRKFSKFPKEEEVLFRPLSLFEVERSTQMLTGKDLRDTDDEPLSNTEPGFKPGFPDTVYVTQLPREKRTARNVVDTPVLEDESKLRKQLWEQGLSWREVDQLVDKEGVKNLTMFFQLDEENLAASKVKVDRMKKEYLLRDEERWLQRYLERASFDTETREKLSREKLRDRDVRSIEAFKALTLRQLEELKLTAVQRKRIRDYQKDCEDQQRRDNRQIVRRTWFTTTISMALWAIGFVLQEIGLFGVAGHSVNFAKVTIIVLGVVCVTVGLLVDSCFTATRKAMQVRRCKQLFFGKNHCSGASCRDFCEARGVRARMTACEKLCFGQDPYYHTIDGWNAWWCAIIGQFWLLCAYMVLSDKPNICAGFLGFFAIVFGSFALFFSWGQFCERRKEFVKLRSEEDEVP